MHKKLFLVLSSLLLLAILTSCEEKKGMMVQPEVFSIQPVSVPSRLNISRIKAYSLSFRVKHPNGVDAIADVSATIFASNQSDILLSTDLYDDGGFNHPGDMDVIARDGIYTNAFLSDSMVFPLGTIYIKATVIDNAQQQLTTDFIPCVSLFNKAPVLVSFSAPDTLPSGSQPVLFSATVQDSNGIEDVPSVTLRLKQQNLTVFSTELNLLNTTAVDSGLYGAYFDSTFAAERIGDYQLEFQAKDLSDDLSNILSNSIFLENIAPVISNIELPDTVQRPTSGADTVTVRISANDSQGLSDIEIVSFVVQREGGMPTTLEMFDDGNFKDHRDLTAGDGIYSRGVSVVDTSVAATFRFTFQAKDKVDNFSQTLIDSLVILP